MWEKLRRRMTETNIRKFIKWQKLTLIAAVLLIANVSVVFYVALCWNSSSCGVIDCYKRYTTKSCSGLWWLLPGSRYDK